MGFVDLFRRDESRESEIKTISSLKTWLNEVPLLDFAKSSVMINDSLSRLSTSTYQGQATLDRLLLYYDSIEQLSELVYQRFVEQLDTSIEIRRADLFFMRDLHLNYAQLFYNVAAPETTKQLNNASIEKALVFALTSYAYGLLRTYQLAIFVPENIWCKIYKLYQILKKIGGEASKNLVMKSGFPLGTRTLSAFYVAILLPTINPNQSEPFELEEAFRFICENANENLLFTTDKESAQFCFLLESDNEPVLRCNYTEKNPPDMYLDITPLYNLLAVSKHNLSLALELKLTKIWDFHGERQISRIREQGVVEIVHGMSGVHGCFSGETVETVETVEPDVTEELTPYLDSHENTEQAAILNYYQTYGVIDKDTQQKSGMFQQWQLSNISEGGACLINQSTDPLEQLSVGELLAMRGIEEKGLNTAIVRWLSLREGRGVLMGVQYLAKDNKPIYVQNEQQKKNGFKYKAILARSTYIAWPELILVTPILPYHTQEKLTLIDNKTEKDVTLLECIERTSNAIFFRIKS